jgi:hypothetical protein
MEDRANHARMGVAEMASSPRNSLSRFDSPPDGYLTLSRCPPGRRRRAGFLSILLCLGILGGTIYALLALF